MGYTVAEVRCSFSPALAYQTSIRSVHDVSLTVTTEFTTDFIAVMEKIYCY